MITMSEYVERRKQLMNKMGSTGIAILPAATEIFRNGDTVYPFRQNSDFYYLTGFDEPDAVGVLSPGSAAEYILFNRIRDPEREIWDGPRAGQEGACETYLADRAYTIESFEEHLPQLLLGKQTIYYTFGINKLFDAILERAINKIRSQIRAGLQPPLAIVDIAFLLHEMRLIKSANEIALMRKAVRISADAHRKAMSICHPGMYEYELEAALVYEFKKQGAMSPAYNTIVGAGKNTCILHYVLNNEKIAAGDLVLIDAGAEYQNYASDITRTFPATGKFSHEQKAIYEIVLECQTALIDHIKPGVRWTDAQEKVIKIITEGLVELKILRGSIDELIASKAYLPFYMHRVGHWLGLDVHDVGSYKVRGEWRKLEESMVFTVEPGIYISPNIPNVDKRWHNIGIRIEDNVLVTQAGCEILSMDIPKKIADIEAIVGKS